MSMVSAFERAKLLGIDGSDAKDGKRAVTHYLETIASGDNRRLMWIVERATRGTAEDMERIEQEIMVAEHFGRIGDAKKKHDCLRRLEEDFRFLYGLEQIVKNDILEQFGRDIATYLKQQKASGK